MRIDPSLSFYTQGYAVSHSQAQAAGQESSRQTEPGVIVDISPQARDAAGKSRGISEAAEYQGCQTCKNRKYQDVSSDPSVSFQTPTKINPGAAASVVAAHENEHVTHEKAKAEREGREIVSQSVTLKTGICPECHRVYVSGGVTRTTSVESKDITDSAAESNRLNMLF
jgi:hypothetical protein